LDRAQELKKQLDYYDNLYYNQDSPELADIEYDAMKAEYLKFTGLEEYNYVPGSAQFKKYKHQFPIKSLGKINTIEQAKEEMVRLNPFIIEPKYDGLTLVVYPDSKAVTRGNGVIGEDVTHNVFKFMRIHSLPIGLPVRGEAIMPISVFNEINKQRELDGLELYKNPRNAMAGILRNKDNSNVPEGLRFIAYEIVGSDLSHMRQLIELKEYYEIPDVNTLFTTSDIDNAIKFIENFDRSKLDYEIDGLVIKSNKADSLNLFGFTEHHNKNSIAFKFANQGVWTRLLGVTWQVGRTGKVSPVAELEPVELMGSTIARATLHNINYMITLDLHINDEVYLVKANDVIPAVIKRREGKFMTSGILRPFICPSCGEPLKTVNDQLYCISNSCEAKLLFRTTHLVKRDALNIDGMSEQTVQKMIEAGYIKEPWDIFDITEAQILKLDGFAKKSAKKIYDNIQNARNCDFDKAIYASGMDLIGRKVSKDIAKEFGTWDELVRKNNNLRNRLSSIEGIGDTIIDSFITNMDLLHNLAFYLNIKVEEKVMSKESTITGKTFCLTGDFEAFKPRKKLEELIESLGGKCSSGVSKNTFALITNNSDSGTKKNQDAVKYGALILNEKEFGEMIGV
jgi:DNA ligase (NAD+)